MRLYGRCVARHEKKCARARTFPAVITLIAAVGKNGVIGSAGKLPWDLPEDRAHFRRETLGHAVIMGRKTWDETGAPLDGRRNIVISRGKVSGEGREVASTLHDAVALAYETDPHPFVIGGGEIFAQALPLASKMILTELDFDAAGDTMFPAFDRNEWEIVDRRNGDRATYVTYVRKKASAQIGA